MPNMPPEKVNWLDKEEALAALALCYPKKEAWNLELAYDMFLATQNEGNEKLKKEVERLGEMTEKELAPHPTIEDYDGYEYDISNNVKIFSPEESKAMDWFCEKCNVYQPFDDPTACNVQRHENGTHCVPCMTPNVEAVEDASQNNVE